MFATLDNINLRITEISEKLEVLKSNYEKSDLKEIVSSEEIQNETQEALSHIQEIGVILKEQKVRLIVDFF